MRLLLVDIGRCADPVRRSCRQWVECHVKVSDAYQRVKVAKATSCGQSATQEACQADDTPCVRERFQQGDERFGAQAGDAGTDRRVGWWKGLGAGNRPHRVDAHHDRRYRVQRQLVAHVAAREQLRHHPSLGRR